MTKPLNPYSGPDEELDVDLDLPGLVAYYKETADLQGEPHDPEWDKWLDPEWLEANRANSGHN